MDSLVGQHDTVLAIKVVTNKVEHETEEQQHSNYMETIESNLYIKSEVDIKLEEIDYESVNVIKKEYLGSDIEEYLDGIDNLKGEGIDTDENPFDIKNEADIEAEQSAPSSIPVAVLSSNPEGGHTLVHQNTLESINSTFETYPHVSKYISNQGKRKSPKNKKSHKALLKCEQCSYETMYIRRLNLHMRVHKDPSELYMYECTHCDFKTKYPYSLKQHSFLHKDGADVPRYKCNSCDYESKIKSALKRHIHSHKNKPKMYIQKPRNPENKNYSEKGMLKCEQCFYECSSPSRLRFHMLVHKDPSELDMYECTHCNFKTKYRTSLKAHSILHKNAADIPTYKCNSCDFETKRKGDLVKHIIRRHNPFILNNLEKAYKL